MYIIWIGWLYVVLMFALGQRTLPMTVFVLILFGALPTWLLLFVVRRRQVMKANEGAVSQDKLMLPSIWKTAGLC